MASLILPHAAIWFCCGLALIFAGRRSRRDGAEGARRTAIASVALLLIDHIVYGVHGVIVVMRVAPQILAIENMSVDSDQVFMFATASAVGSLLLPDILLGLLAFRLTRLTACDRPSRRLKDCR